MSEEKGEKLKGLFNRGLNFAIDNKESILNIASTALNTIKTNDNGKVIDITEDSSSLQTEVIAEKTGLIGGIINRLPSVETIKQKIIMIIEAFSPIKIDINESLDKKAIVVGEKFINDYVKKSITDENISNLEIKIFDENIIQLDCDLKKLGIKSRISQKFDLVKFVIDKDDAFAQLKMLDYIDVKGSRWFDKVILSIVKFIVISVFKEKFVGILRENNVEVNGNDLKIDIKKAGTLDKFYNKTIKELISDESLSLPNLDLVSISKTLALLFLDKKRVIELINVSEIKTELGKVIIKLKFSFKGIKSE